MNSNQDVHDAVDGKNYEVHVAINHNTPVRKIYLSNRNELSLFHRLSTLLLPIMYSANTESDHNVASEWLTEAWHVPL